MDSELQAYDHLAKVLTLGDSLVGKSNLLLRYSEGEFRTNYMTTIGVDFKSKIYQEGDFRLKLQIWDTAGQEQFRVITEGYFKGASGALLVYSIDNRESFMNVNDWVRQLKAKAKGNLSIVLVGNKCDIEEERQVYQEEGEKLCKELNLTAFFETSAKTNFNVEKAFEAISHDIIKNFQSVPRQKESFKLSQADSTQSKQKIKEREKVEKSCTC